jgi:hypothetical protein
MSEAEDTPVYQKPRCRRCKYLVRALLIMAAIAALPLGLIAWEAKLNQKARNAYAKAVLADPDDKPTYQDFVATRSFPYSASPARRERIKANYPQLRVGLHKAEVAIILGEPDCSERMATKSLRPRYLGSAWTYYLDKPDPNMVNEKNDKTVDVFFDQVGEVHWIVSNVEGLAEIGSYKRANDQ